MPWSKNDGPARHTKKANTGAKKEQWAATANSVRSREMASGASEEEADGKAVRIANSAVKKRAKGRSRG